MTTMTKDACEKLGFLDPKDVADSMKVEPPKAPDVRPAADELHPINPHQSRGLTAAIAVTAAAGLVAGFLGPFA